VTLCEEALVQLTRLGLNGDAASIERFAKRFLRQAAGDASIADATKHAIAVLVANQITKPLRLVDSMSVGKGSAFLTVERDVASEEPLLPIDAAAEVNAIVAEHARAAELAEVGLAPARTILLTGAPGVGKTITARSMARRLDVPLFRADLSTLMSSYLGKTGQNLHEAFAQARSVPSVLLLDEFDAIAKRRDDPSDVGELKRIVNVLLLELDVWPATNLLVAATNHPELLDRAIWRRFEKVVEIGLPSDDVRRLLLQRTLEKFQRTANITTLDGCVAATAGLSCSDVVAFANACVKRSVLSREAIDQVLYAELLVRFRSQFKERSELRRVYSEFASLHLGMTQREIARQLEISHVMVGKFLRQAGAKPARRAKARRG
jgi:SpoVK/Ycf46/Vps4 family AAA+-type ATPase